MARRGTLWRIVRGVLIALGGLLALVAVLLATLFFVGRSDWGRRQILSLVLPMVEKPLAGTLRVGKLDGDLTHMLVLRDVEVLDVEGQLAARLPYVGLRYNLLALLGRTLHLTAVDIRQAEVHGRLLQDGRVNLAALTRPDNSPPSTGPLPIRIIVSGVDAALTATFDGAPALGEPLAHAAVGLRLRGGIHLRPDRRLTVDVDGLDIAASTPLEARLGLKGQLALSLLDAARTLTLKDVAMTVATDGAQVTRLAPAAGLRGPLALEAKLAGGLQELATELKLTLPAGQARLQAQVGLLDGKFPWQVALLALDGFEPAALWPDGRMPPARIDLSMAGRGAGTSGRVELRSVSLRLGRNAVSLTGSVEAPEVPPVWQDPLAAQAQLALKLEGNDLAELAKLGLGLPPLAGSLVGNVRIEVQKRQLGLGAHLHGAHLVGPGLALGRLQLDVETTDLAGKLQLVADDLAAAGQRLGHLALTAAGDRRLVRLSLDGDGPEEVKVKLALQARPEIVGGGGLDDLKGLKGARLVGVAAALDELRLQRAGAELSLQQPAALQLRGLPAAPVVEVQHLALALGSLKLRLDGAFETQGQRLRAALEASGLDVRELVRVATGATTAPKTALGLHLDLGGTVTAPTGKLQLSGRVEPIPGVLPWPVAPELAATFAERRARGSLAVRAEAKSGAAPTVKASFDAPLGREGTIELKLDAESALEALQPLLPPALQPLSGAVAATVSLGGTLRQPQVELQVRLPHWQLAPLRGVETALRVTYASRQAQLLAQLATQLQNLDGQPLGRVELTARAPLHLGIDSTGPAIVEELRGGAGTAELTLRELALPRLAALDARIAQEAPLGAGSAEVAVQVRGPLSGPQLVARLDARGLRPAPTSGLPDVSFDAGLRADYKPDDLGLTLSLDLDGKPLLRGQGSTRVAVAELVRDGAKLLDRLPLQVQVDVLPTPLPAGLPVAGTIRGHAELRGTLPQPAVTADVRAAGLLVGDWPVGDLTAHAALDRGQLLQAQAEIAQPGKAGAGTLSLDATVPLPFDLAAEALKVGLRAHGFRIDYQARKGAPAAVRLVRGTLESDVTVQGGSPQPLLSGTLAFRDGQLTTSAMPQLIREIAVEVRAQPDGVVRLERLAARADQGRLRGEGRLRLAGGALRSVELGATIDNFPVAAGQIAMWLNTRVEIVGTAGDDTLRLKVGIPYGTVRLPKLTSGNDSDVQPLGPLDDIRFIDAAAEAAEAEAKRRQAAAAKDNKRRTPLLPPRMLLTVQLPPSFAVTGPEVKTSVHGHVDVELSERLPAGPVVTGEVHTLGGTVEIIGRRYDLERAQVSMSGEVPPNPLLNVVLSRKLDEATIYIQVTGTARKPVITFRSEPPIYDQAQVIAIVLSGSSRGGTLQQQALGALSGLLIGKLKDSLGKAVPVDVIKFDVGGNDASGVGQSSLEVGKYLRDNLYLSYTHRFGNPSTILHRLNNDQVSLEWYFLPNYQINLMGGDQGVGSLNLYWTKRY